MKRYKITKALNGYVIMDRMKRATFMRDKRFTKFVFETPEMAEGFLFGKFK